MFVVFVAAVFAARTPTSPPVENYHLPWHRMYTWQQRIRHVDGDFSYET